ncbi:MAG: HEPN domain-containing protein [Oscillospiraceae bacterium]|nr:HEPN domain-containing protein [Oscillospiraceae bacterium]
MTDNSNIVREWYKFSMRDFETAKYICGMHPKPLEIICYLSQQSAEKMLKGYLVSNEIEPPKIHDLSQLRIMCSEINDSFDKLQEVCKQLNPFGSQPRYPDEIEILETDMEKALESVQEMIVFFEEQGIEVKPT